MDIRVERFAHHLFRYVFHELKVPKEKIYPINNEMVSNDYTDDIGFAVVTNALCFRSDIKHAFDKNPKLVMGTKDFEDLVRRWLDVFIPKKNILNLTIGSCLLFAEFTIRKYSEDENFDLTSVPKLWASFFIDNFLEEFSRKEGTEFQDIWDDLKKTAKDAQIVDTGVKSALSELQHPYGGLKAIDNFKNFLPQRQSKIKQFDSLKRGEGPLQTVDFLSYVPDWSYPLVKGEAPRIHVNLKRSTALYSEIPKKIAKESPKKKRNT